MFFVLKKIRKPFTLVIVCTRGSAESKLLAGLWLPFAGERAVLIVFGPLVSIITLLLLGLIYLATLTGEAGGLSNVDSDFGLFALTKQKGGTNLKHYTASSRLRAELSRCVPAAVTHV